MHSRKAVREMNVMRIASYNLWNSDRGMPERGLHLVDTIKEVKPDIIGLQEVKNKAQFNYIEAELNMLHGVFFEHKGRVIEAEPWKENEGLAIFSNYQILDSTYMEYAMFALIDYSSTKILVVNLHLPWDSVLAKEKCILAINREIMKYKSDFRFILGDFNCSENSSVHQFLKGDRSLNYEEVYHYWTDLAEVAEEFLDVPKESTINLKTNPRWGRRVLADKSTRVDCIFMHDCFPNDYPIPKGFQYFGKCVNSDTNLCPSDHYGVCVDLQMPKKK
jgi:endonuclease/exonuclease/phosphatase family metal-dependent hydrolase